MTDKKTQDELREAAKKAGKKAYEYNNTMYKVDTNKKVTTYDNFKAGIKKAVSTAVKKKTVYKKGGFRDTFLEPGIESLD